MTPNAIDKAIAALEVSLERTEDVRVFDCMEELSIAESHIREALTSLKALKESVGDVEEIVGRAIVKEAWAIEGLPVKALATGYRLLGRAAIAALSERGLLQTQHRK